MLPQKSGIPWKTILGLTCWNWDGHEHLLIPTHTQMVAKMLTATLPSHKTGSEEPFYLHFCTPETSCFSIPVRLEQRMPRQGLTFKGIVRNRQFCESIPSLDDIEIEAKSSED